MPSKVTRPVLDLMLRDKAVAGDTATVRRLAADTGFFRDDEVNIAVELVEERLAKGPASGYEFLFAERAVAPAQVPGQRSTLGYACFGPIACTLHSWDLFWIVTDPRWQGHGVGSRLLGESEARIAARGGRRLYVETSSRASYAATRRFYEARGYRVEATLPEFYGPGDGKLVYVKELANPPGARAPR